MAHTSRLPVCTPSLRAKTVKREASMGHITLPVDGSGRTWCSRRLACVALGDISDAELDALIIAEPEATIAERAEAQSTSPVPVSLDECTRVLAASWADEARWVARACGCTVTSVVDAAYAKAVREIRNDLLPPVPEPPHECAGGPNHIVIFNGVGATVPGRWDPAATAFGWEVACWG